ncbi:MAG: 2-oxoacid:acceptor oxidoreductase family protein [Clostridiales bacterium]|nr:2-oxoacid:acceptor oxidoreductase family protein [Clostridiales bacterium]
MKIIISGFGGQGVLSLGKFISYSAIEQDLNTSWLPAYGPEMRGGTANCSVIYSAEEIASPVIDSPDILIAFNEPSLVKFEGMVKPGGIIITNSDIVGIKATRKDCKVYEIPVDTLASAINKRGANVFMLGVLLPIFKDISMDSAIHAVEHVFESKPKIIPVNIQCLKAGYEYMSKLV